MKSAAILIALFFFPIAAFSEVVVGSGTLKYIGTSDYQPGSCESEKRDPKTCITFSWYRVYAVNNFRNVSANKPHNIKVVIPSHSTPEGKFFLVLQKLSDEEAQKFNAQFEAIEIGPIFNTACLDKEIQTYQPQSQSKPYIKDENEGYCYALEDLERGQ